MIDGYLFPTGEHAFQAFKSEDPEYKKDMCTNKNPVVAKRKGRRVKITDINEWNHKRDEYMLTVVRAKFQQNADLAKQLLATEDRDLIEGNNHNDTYWGASLKTGKGLNKLGRILETVREELYQSTQSNTEKE